MTIRFRSFLRHQLAEENDECELEIFGNIPGRQCGPHLKCHKNSKGIGVCTKSKQSMRV